MTPITFSLYAIKKFDFFENDTDYDIGKLDDALVLFKDAHNTMELLVRQWCFPGFTINE